MSAALIQPDSNSNCCECSRDGCADCAECQQMGDTLSLAISGISSLGCAMAAPGFNFSGCTMTALATGLNGVFTCIENEAGNPNSGWSGLISGYPANSATVYQIGECDGVPTESSSSQARLSVTCNDGGAPDYLATFTVTLIVDWYVYLGGGAAGDGTYVWQGTGPLGSAITFPVHTTPAAIPNYALSDGTVTVTQP
jgi:hypothetical protein